jgi:hypothetical protein
VELMVRLYRLGSCTGCSKWLQDYLWICEMLVWCWVMSRVQPYLLHERMNYTSLHECWTSVPILFVWYPYHYYGTLFIRT